MAFEAGDVCSSKDEVRARRPCAVRRSRALVAKRARSRALLTDVCAPPRSRAPSPPHSGTDIALTRAVHSTSTSRAAAAWKEQQQQHSLLADPCATER